MNTTQKQQLFAMLKEKTNEVMDDTQSQPDEFIDYQNGETISMHMIEQWFYAYQSMSKAITHYIDSNQLDDMGDCAQINKHFPEYVPYTYSNGQYYECSLEQYVLLHAKSLVKIQKPAPKKK